MSNSTKQIKQWLLVAHNAINHITVINTNSENSDTIHLTASSIRNSLASLDCIMDEREIATCKTKTEGERK